MSRERPRQYQQAYRRFLFSTAIAAIGLFIVLTIPYVLGVAFALFDYDGICRDLTNGIISCSLIEYAINRIFFLHTLTFILVPIPILFWLLNLVDYWAFRIRDNWKIELNKTMVQFLCLLVCIIVSIIASISIGHSSSVFTGWLSEVLYYLEPIKITESSPS